MSALYWVWLQLVLGNGDRHLHELLESFSDAQTIYRLRDSSEMRSLCLPVQVMQRLKKQTQNAAIEQVENCNAQGVQIIPYNSPSYPPQLRNIENPPAVLYAVGTLPDFPGRCGVAMVGTRKATDYGVRAAFSLSFRLARAGCLMISGIADGVDRAAHLGALAAEMPTVAILPCGHRQSYLGGKQALLDSILAAGGCLLSELPPMAVMPKNSFQLRNRLISGISEATVVVQAPAKSGALLTASSAIQQGRDLFVVTGMPADPSFAGSYSLIRDGATPIFHARDVLEALPSSFGLDLESAFAGTPDLAAAYRRAYPKSQNISVKEHKTKEPAQNEKQTPPCEKRQLPEGLSETVATVYRTFSMDGEYIDTIVEKTGFDSGSVLSALTQLEICGLIRSATGGKYRVL